MADEKDYITFRFPKYTKLHIVITAILVTAAFALGSFWTKMQYLETLGSATNTASGANTASGTTAQAPQAAPEDTSPKNVSADDDPIMGSKDAPLTLIEFSDYECPFCKSFYNETLPQLKKDYIDTGKVKLVYRDLPLAFHANAHKEAQAAECAREQGGDEMYFRYHDEIFKRTTSNGTGLALDQLPVIASDIGIDSAAFQQCLTTEKFKAEVDKDLSDASAVNANATPTFFLGKSTQDGSIQGTPIVGAQPYSVFKTVIDQALQ